MPPSSVIPYLTDMIEARDHVLAMRDITSDAAETLPGAEVDT